MTGDDARDDELLQQLSRGLRAADSLLAGIADDMAAAGAQSASERTERARAELQAAAEIAAELARRRGGTAGR